MGAIGNVSLEGNKIYIHIYSYMWHTYSDIWHMSYIWHTCHSHTYIYSKSTQFTLSQSTLTSYESSLPNIYKYMTFMYKHI